MITINTMFTFLTAQSQTDLPGCRSVKQKEADSEADQESIRRVKADLARKDAQLKAAQAQADKVSLPLLSLPYASGTCSR